MTPEPGAGHDSILDATLVAAHSEQENALAVLLRPGNAGSNTAADHITVIKGALTQLPGRRPATRAGRKVLIRIDGAGSTHAVLDWMTTQTAVLLGGVSPCPRTPSDLLEHIPKDVWAPAYDAHDKIRDGAWVA